jgi:hypothetical protein
VLVFPCVLFSSTHREILVKKTSEFAQTAGCCIVTGAGAGGVAVGAGFCATGAGFCGAGAVITGLGATFGFNCGNLVSNSVII